MAKGTDMATGAERLFKEGESSGNPILMDGERELNFWMTINYNRPITAYAFIRDWTWLGMQSRVTDSST
ncbi:MAG: hypothetical protein ACREBS_00060 [Nitrososphaerales archaeon]